MYILGQRCSSVVQHVPVHAGPDFDSSTTDKRIISFGYPSQCLYSVISTFDLKLLKVFLLLLIISVPAAQKAETRGLQIQGYPWQQNETFISKNPNKSDFSRYQMYFRGLSIFPKGIKSCKLLEKVKFSESQTVGRVFKVFFCSLRRWL